MPRTWEILARPPKNEDIRSEFSRFLSISRERGWDQLKVMFGYAWGNYVRERDWREEVISPDELDSIVKSAEKKQDGAISDDDLFVTVLATGVQYTFCHENDIHLGGEPGDETLMAEVARYQELGWEVYERHTREGEIGGEWQLINRESGMSSPGGAKEPGS